MKLLRTRTIKLLAATFCAGVIPINTYAAPNFVLIELANMPVTDIAYLPGAAAFLRSNGVEFTNAFTAQSLCAPSRAMILTGKYAHNTGVRTNTPPDGGYNAFYLNGNDSKTIATWLTAHGYATAFFGSYMNGIGSSRSVVPITHVPSGWSEWYGKVGTAYYYDFTLNENGTLVKYGSTPADYGTDVLAVKASQVMARFVNGPKPFFMMISPSAVHEDGITGLPIPAPRHTQMTFEGLRAPRSASFNEMDISDKSKAFRSRPLLTEADIAALDRIHRLRAQTLLAVDEMIIGLIDQLAAAKVLNNTFIILTTDHGIFLGDHRRSGGYGEPFEAVNRVPLLVSGPGVLAASRPNDLVVNVDIFPTVAELSQVGIVPTEVDGRSFAALIKSRSRSSDTFRSSFIRYGGTTKAGLRLATYSYKESYGIDGTVNFRELYDLRLDPDETFNIASRLTAESVLTLGEYVRQFKACSGASCRTLENIVNDDVVRLQPFPP